MDINGAVNLIHHNVIVQFRMDRAEAPWVFLPKITRAKEEEIHEGPLKRCSGRFCILHLTCSYCQLYVQWVGVSGKRLMVAHCNFKQLYSVWFV
jgi:hypothetical protein